MELLKKFLYLVGNKKDFREIFDSFSEKIIFSRFLQIFQGLVYTSLFNMPEGYFSIFRQGYVLFIFQRGQVSTPSICEAEEDWTRIEEGMSVHLHWSSPYFKLLYFIHLYFISRPFKTFNKKIWKMFLLKICSAAFDFFFSFFLSTLVILENPSN